MFYDQTADQSKMRVAENRPHRAIAAAVAREAETGAPHRIFMAAGGGLAALAVATAWLAPSGLAVPALGTAALGLAALASALAWVLSTAEKPATNHAWNAAGILAFIGFGCGVVGDPQAIAHFVLGQNDL